MPSKLWVQRERDIRELEERGGAVTVRSAGSLGPVDVVSITRDAPALDRSIVKFIEVKASGKKRGAYADFEPEKRKRMVELAEQAGASAWLFWWPPHGVLQRIPSDDWPMGKRAQAAFR